MPRQICLDSHGFHRGVALVMSYRCLRNCTLLVLKSHCSSGDDSILPNAAHTISMPLSNVFNNSLKFGIDPTSLMQIIIIAPVYEVAKNHNLNFATSHMFSSFNIH